MNRREAKKLAVWAAAQTLRAGLAVGWNPGRDRGLPEADQGKVCESLKDLISELERRGRLRKEIDR